MKQKRSETDIRREIVQYLRLTGWFCYHNLAGIGTYPGLSDLVAVKDGKVIHIEVKRPGGRQSEKQKQFQADLEVAGGKYLIATSIDDLEGVG